MPLKSGCPLVSSHYCYLKPPATKRLSEKQWQLEGPVRRPLGLETPDQPAVASEEGHSHTAPGKAP